MLAFTLASNRSRRSVLAETLTLPAGRALVSRIGAAAGASLRLGLVVGATGAAEAPVVDTATVEPLLGADGSTENVTSVTMPSDISTVALDAVLAVKLG